MQQETRHVTRRRSIGALTGGVDQRRAMLENLGPKIYERDFAPGFMVDLAQKDISPCAGIGGGAGPSPGTHTAAVTQIFNRSAQRMGSGEYRICILQASPSKSVWSVTWRTLRGKRGRRPHTPSPLEASPLWDCPPVYRRGSPAGSMMSHSKPRLLTRPEGPDPEVSICIDAVIETVEHERSDRLIWR